MQRYLLTLLMMGAISGLYLVYAAVVLPMTAAMGMANLDLLPEEPSIRPPAMFEQLAREQFPEVEWTHHAEHCWQVAEHVYLYFRRHERVAGTGNTVLIAPVAIIWKDPRRPEQDPYRILAERAQVKFENEFFDSAIALSDAEPGRVIWGSLEGNVTIAGPDHLKIAGQNFKFEESSAQLYSDYPISFEFGPAQRDQMRIAGTADSMRLGFIPSEESAYGKDMPRVAGLAHLLLRRNVVLDASYVQGQKQKQAHMTSAGSFLYDVSKREATFDDKVHVTQLTAAGTGWDKDSISCEWLQVRFDQPDQSSSPAAAVAAADHSHVSSPFDGLVFRGMRAQGSKGGHGSRMTITSSAQQLTAMMQDLAYDALKRQAVMRDDQQVIIDRGTTRFICPRIGMQHGEQSELEQLDCRGPGQMEITNEAFGKEPLTARWAAGVQVLPDAASGTHEIRLERQAQLVVPDRFGVAADVLRLWVDLQQARGQTGTASVTEASPAALNRPLPLKRARAEGQVRVSAEMLKVSRADVVDAIIRQGVIPPDSSDAAATDASGGDATSRNREGEQPASPWVVEADRLELDLIHDPIAGKIDARRINGYGDLQVMHDPGRPMKIGTRQVEGPLVIQGNQLAITNGGGIRQVLTVTGQRAGEKEQSNQATVQLGSAKLSGTQITLAREENRLDVPGPGGITVPIPSTIQGAGDGSVLNIVWNEGMTFDGLLMRFWGKVTTALPAQSGGGSRLLCEDLSIWLNQRFSFADPQKREAGRELDYEKIEGRHNVTLESIEYKGNDIASVRRGELAAFQIIHATGDFEGDGPGEIHSWTLGDSVRFSPAEVPQANQPARAAAARWRYSGVKFAGKIDGNMPRSQVRLNDRVEVITAPVEKALVKFQRNQLSETTPDAENAVWMRCDQLRIIQRAVPEQKEKFSELFAVGSTQLEGHSFYAYADELTYDERRGQFILRGLGKDANLYYQPQPGLPASPTAARLIEFVPAKQKININGSNGIHGSY
jgi:hypothetical protein